MGDEEFVILVTCYSQKQNPGFSIPFEANPKSANSSWPTIFFSVKELEVSIDPTRHHRRWRRWQKSMLLVMLLDVCEILLNPP